MNLILRFEGGESNSGVESSKNRKILDNDGTAFHGDRMRGIRNLNEKGNVFSRSHCLVLSRGGTEKIQGIPTSSRLPVARWKRFSPPAMIFPLSESEFA